MMSDPTLEVDVAVLGGGIGGYSAAIRAAQLGKTVAIVEKDKMGGTCLHRGCIPSKSLLRSAEMFAAMKDSTAYGIEASEVTLNFLKVQQRKNEIVQQLHEGVHQLMKANKIKVIEGSGRIIGPSIFSPRSGALAVERSDGQAETIVSQNLIVATGSRPRTIEGIDIDGDVIMTSDHALEMTELPQSIVIVGGGVIGVEWASLLNDFGVKVTIVESADRIVPHEDVDIAKQLHQLFEERGIDIYVGATMDTSSIKVNDDGVQLTVQHQDEQLALTATKMLICIGRQANIEQLGIENTDITVEHGFIKVNEHLQTTEGHIYAIGDVIGGVQLAHAAAHEGMVAAEHIAGQSSQRPAQHFIPRCIYGRPEIASIGWTEQQARERGYDVKSAKISFKHIGKALVYGATDGFVKVIVDRERDDLLGVHMIGPHVTDYISEAVLAQILDATPWEISQAIHPHPSLAEGLSEAMAAVERL